MSSPPNRSRMPTPQLVDTPEGLAKLMDMLHLKRLFALDTESDSLFRYTPRVCVVQLAVPVADPDREPFRANVFLIDVLAVDIQPLGALLARPDLEVVMHAAENDMVTLGRDYGFHINQVFDTQLAARILGRSRVGLASMLDQEFGVKSDKRMQRTNWGQRPLEPEQKYYAAMDAFYLLPLRVMLMEELRRAGRWEEAQEAFGFLSRVDLSNKPLPDRSVWSMRDVRKVPQEQMGLLESLWEWREAEARRLNRPPFKVMNDRILLALAAQPPQSVRELGRLPALSDRQVSRYGEALLQAVRSGRERTPSAPPTEPRGTRPDEEVQSRYDALRAWRSRTARDRGVDPDIVLSNEVLMQIAADPPESGEDLLRFPAIGPWKARTYGPQITRVLARRAHKDPHVH